MSDAHADESEMTPVDDVRTVRERLHREAGGDIHVLVERANEVLHRYREQLGLNAVSRQKDAAHRTET